MKTRHLPAFASEAEEKYLATLIHKVLDQELSGAA
jgi:hypothetical protein